MAAVTHRKGFSVLAVSEILQKMIRPYSPGRDTVGGAVLFGGDVAKYISTILVAETLQWSSRPPKSESSTSVNDIDQPQEGKQKEAKRRVSRFVASSIDFLSVLINVNDIPYAQVHLALLCPLALETHLCLLDHPVPTPSQR